MNDWKENEIFRIRFLLSLLFLRELFSTMFKDTIGSFLSSVCIQLANEFVLVRFVTFPLQVELSHQWHCRDKFAGKAAECSDHVEDYLFVTHLASLLGEFPTASNGKRVNFFEVCARGMAHRLIMSLFASRKIRYFVRCRSRRNERIWWRRFRALEKRFWYLAEHGTLLLNFGKRISTSSASNFWCRRRQTVLAGFGWAGNIISSLLLYNRIVSFRFKRILFFLCCLAGILWKSTSRVLVPIKTWFV